MANTGLDIILPLVQDVLQLIQVLLHLLINEHLRVDIVVDVEAERANLSLLRFL